jgi:hypothetical protein
MLRKIRLELARTPEYPEGNTDQGYELVLPLQTDGHIDPQSYRAMRDQCRVHRFWKGEKIQSGAILHTGPNRWVFSYEPGTEDDEPVYKLDQHVFRVGEYLSIREPDGRMLPFKIVVIE